VITYCAEANVPEMPGEPTEPEVELAEPEAEPIGVEASDETADVRREQRWRWALLAVCLVALGVRLVYLFNWQAVEEIGGDAWYYHEAANLLADGEGFVHPYFMEEGVRAPGADHPPGYSIVLAAFSSVGIDTIRGHQVVTCLIGTGTVALMGLVGHRIGGRGRRGRQVGLLAAGFGALYPNMWMNDPSLMSESLAMFAGVGFALAAYWTWDRPSLARLAGLGATLGLATLVRAEAGLLFLLAVVPLCLWAPRLSGWRPRLAGGAVVGAAAALVLLPWVVPNLVRFEHPATLSTQMGPTLEVGNCDPTYFGEDRSGIPQLAGDFAVGLGGWTASCASELVSEGELVEAGVDRVLPAPTADEAVGDEEILLEPGSDRVLWVRRYYSSSAVLLGLPGDVDRHDRSELDNLTTDAAVDYMGDHKSRLPFILGARFGRAFGLYAPDEQLKMDRFTDDRPYEAARAGLGLYYLTAGAAVAGVVALRRWGVPSFPLTASIVSVAFTVVLFYGTTRFRAPAEPGLVLLGAVGAHWLFQLLRRSADERGQESVERG
jgi:4-amino-4-deoxy-L-arabinose transferase-like glycosyltransferase